MEAYNVIKNRQLQAMLEPVRNRLQKYSPEVLCRKAKVSFDENSQCFCLPSMAQDTFIECIYWYEVPKSDFKTNSLIPKQT